MLTPLDAIPRVDAQAKDPFELRYWYALHLFFSVTNQRYELNDTRFSDILSSPLIGNPSFSEKEKLFPEFELALRGYLAEEEFTEEVREAIDSELTEARRLHGLINEQMRLVQRHFILGYTGLPYFGAANAPAVRDAVRRVAEARDRVFLQYSPEAAEEYLERVEEADEAIAASNTEVSTAKKLGQHEQLREKLAKEIFFNVYFGDENA